MSEDLRVVIVGSGRTGLRTARLLHQRGHSVVIVERNPDRVADLVAESGVTIIEGDATNPAVLAQAGLAKVDVLVAVTDTMGTNFTVCTLPREHNPDIRAVMRSVFEETAEYEAFADEIVVPERAGARLAINAVESGVQSVEDTAANVELLEISVHPGAPVAGRELAEVSLPRGAVVVSNVEGTRIADADTELRSGETYVVAVEPAVADTVRQLFRG